MRVTPEELRDICRSLPGAVETFPFSEGVAAYKVEGKIFAISRLEGSPFQVSLKCEPELAEQLRATHEAIRPGYHLNKRHWNTVTVDGSLADDLVRALIEDSWALVVDGLPARVRERLTAEGR
jgi:predicted DNA-binding protein (MmcQ/YjbR family)